MEGRQSFSTKKCSKHGFCGKLAAGTGSGILSFIVSLPLLKVNFLKLDFRFLW